MNANPQPITFYTCNCKYGYTGDGHVCCDNKLLEYNPVNKQCADLNECTAGFDNCDPGFS